MAGSGPPSPFSGNGLSALSPGASSNGDDTSVSRRKRGSRVRFSADVVAESEGARSRRSMTLNGSTSSEAPEELAVDIGLIQTNHAYEVNVCDLEPGTELSCIQSSSQKVTADTCEQDSNGCSDGANGLEQPYLKVRLISDSAGPFEHCVSLTAVSSFVQQELLVRLRGHCMTENQGKPSLRGNVSCIGSVTQDSTDAD